MAYLDWGLAVFVTAGFALAYLGQGQPTQVRISELTDADIGKTVLIVGQVRWHNATRFQLCQGLACVRAVVFGRVEADWMGRTVAAQGRWQKDVFLISSGNSVDILG